MNAEGINTVLEDDDFEPTQMITSIHSLERNRQELFTVLNQLKADLVSLINRDYESLIRLTNKLVGVADLIQDMNMIQASITSPIKEALDLLVPQIIQLEDHIKQKTALQSKKNSLSIIIRIDDSINRIDLLLSLDVGVDVLERIVVEYNLLGFLVDQGSHLAFVEKNLYRINRIKQEIISVSDSLLKTALNQSSSANLAQLLKIYLHMERTRDALAIMSLILVEPFISSKIKSLKFDAIDLDQVSELVEKVYIDILSFATIELSWVVDVCEKTSTCFLVDCYWEPVIKEFIKSFSPVFNPGVPDLFHKNYTNAIRFENSFEKLVDRHLDLFKTNPVFLEFNLKWQVDVYFILRQKEINAIFDQGKHILAIETCWDSKIFLESITHRFYKLTIDVFKINVS